MSAQRTTEIEAKREAAVQAMIGKGYTRERAEHLLFEVVGKTLFGPDGAFDSPEPSGFDLPGMWEDSDLIGGSTEPLSPPELCVAPPGNLCTDTGCWDMDRCVIIPPETTTGSES